MEKEKSEIKYSFNGKNIPVTKAAEIMGKDAAFVIQGLVNVKIPIGCAFNKYRY